MFKIIKLFILLLMLMNMIIPIGCSKKENPIKHPIKNDYFYDTGIAWDCARNNFFHGVIEISIILERQKREIGKYPIVLSDKIREEFHYFLRGTDFFNSRNYKYESDGLSYRLLICSSYKICTGDNYTAIIITNKAIYWKDNYIEPWQSVDDVDWSKVDFVVSEKFIDENGNEISTPAVPPKIPYPVGYKESILQSDIHP